MVISVCVGSSCHLKGSNLIINALQRMIENHDLREKIVMKGQFCTGHCQSGVCVMLDEQLFSVKPDTVESFFSEQVLPRV